MFRICFWLLAGTAATAVLPASAAEQVVPSNFDLRSLPPLVIKTQTDPEPIMLRQEHPATTPPAFIFEIDGLRFAGGLNGASSTNLQHRDWHPSDEVHWTTKGSLGLHLTVPIIFFR